MQFKEGSWSESQNTVTVPEDGIYSLSLAITTTSAAQRATDVMTFSVNGVSIEEESSNAYVRNSSSINEAACTLTTMLSLSSGDTIGIMSRREGTVTGSGSTVGSKSSISIHKL